MAAVRTVMFTSPFRIRPGSLGRNRKNGLALFRDQLNNLKHHREDNMDKKLTTAFGAPVDDNQNIATAGERGPALLQNIWFLEKMAHFDREVIPERRMHAKGSGAFGTFTVTHGITKY